MDWAGMPVTHLQEALPGRHGRGLVRLQVAQRLRGAQAMVRLQVLNVGRGVQATADAPDAVDDAQSLGVRRDDAELPCNGLHGLSVRLEQAFELVEAGGDGLFEERVDGFERGTGGLDFLLATRKVPLRLVQARHGAEEGLVWLAGQPGLDHRLHLLGHLEVLVDLLNLGQDVADVVFRAEVPVRRPLDLLHLCVDRAQPLVQLVHREDETLRAELHTVQRVRQAHRATTTAAAPTPTAARGIDWTFHGASPVCSPGYNPAPAGRLSPR